MMDQRYMVKQYVAVARSSRGQRWMVFETGDARYYLFHALEGETSVMLDCVVSVQKTNIKDARLRSALRHGIGNSI